MAVICSGVVLIGFFAWFFFGPQKAPRAELFGQVQQVQVLVEGGYAPDPLRVRASVPPRIAFYRPTGAESRLARRGCSDLLGDVTLARATWMAEPAPASDNAMAALPQRRVTAASSNGGHAARPADAAKSEEAERNAEIADLTHRVIAGALLTAPVLFAAMSDGFLHLSWLPSLLLNHWLQLAPITPRIF